MPRWRPDARERLLIAAVELFEERGYDATTVAQIADRAGLNRSTFFRHFPDKREVLVAGQDALSALLAAGVAEAPVDADVIDAVGAGLQRASSELGRVSRELGPRLRAAVAASTELQGRDALKSIGMAAAIAGALSARGVAVPVAQVAAELGVLAFKQGYARWVEDARGEEVGLAHHALATLAELADAAARLRGTTGDGSDTTEFAWRDSGTLGGAPITA